MIKRPLAARAYEGGVRWRGRRWLPAAAAGVLFASAFGVGMATKSGSSPQTATSLASPVSIQAPPVSVPALQRDVPTPALKARPKPDNRHPAPPTNTATSSATAAAPPSPGPSAPPVTQSPPSRVIHGQSGGAVHGSGGGGSGSGGSGGGGSVVHGGN